MDPSGSEVTTIGSGLKYHHLGWYPEALEVILRPRTGPVEDDSGSQGKAVIDGQIPLNFGTLPLIHLNNPH